MSAWFPPDKAMTTGCERALTIGMNLGFWTSLGASFLGTDSK
jgi:hypothetical protein